MVVFGLCILGRNLLDAFSIFLMLNNDMRKEQ